MIFRLVPAATLAALVVSLPAAAQTVTASYNIDNPEANAIELNYGAFGYTNDEGEFVVLTGNRIVESRATINFRPGMVDNGSGTLVPFKVENLQVSMLVPSILEDPNGSELFVVNGSDLVETTPGVFTYNLVTTAFNGEIRPGRFSVDILASDPNTGEPVPLAGELFGGSGFFHTVAVPEPASLAAIGLGLCALRRRRLQ